MILRNPKYLAWLKTQRCIFTGLPGTEYEPIDPMHIGTAGRGLKSPDNEVLPIRHWLHQHAHIGGEVSMLRECAPDDVIRAAFRAYARELYAKYLEEHPAPEAEPRKRVKKKRASKFKRRVDGTTVLRGKAA